LHLREQRRQDDEARRLAERRGARVANLEQVRNLMQRARWAEARAVLRQLQAGLADDPDPDGQDDVVRAGADLDLVEELSRIQLLKANWALDHFDTESGDRAYQKALGRLGLADMSRAPEQAAHGVRGSPIQAQLVAALDDWVYTTTDQARRRWLFAVANQLAPDPWRERLAALPHGDSAALQRLAQEAMREPGLSAAQLFMLAWAMQGRGVDAESLLRAAQAHHPAEFLSNFNLGVALIGRDPAEALGFFRAAGAARPGTAAVSNNIGLCLVRTNRLADAEAAYRRAIEQDARLLFAWNNLSELLLVQGRLGEGADALFQAERLAPGDAEVRSLRGKAARLAVGCRQRGDYRGSLRYTQAAVLFEPRNAERWNDLGLFYDRHRQPRAAIAAYRRAVELDPKLRHPLVHLSDRLLSQGRFGESIDLLHQAQRLAPGHVSVRALRQKPFVLALAWRRRGDGRASVRYAQVGVLLSPRNAQAWTNLGTVQYERGNVAAALAAWEEALRLDPLHAGALGSLGMAYKHRGDLQGALAVHRRAVALAPGKPLGHASLAGTLLAVRDVDGALNACAEAVRLDPRCADGWYFAGAALNLKVELGRAESAYRRAIDLEPGRPRHHVGLGEVLARQGRIEEALRSFEHARALGAPTWPLDSWLARGRNTLRMGQAEGHLKALLAGRPPALTPRQRLEVAYLCLSQKDRPVLAAQLFREGLAAEPAVVDEGDDYRRFQAACAAVLAAAGRGRDSTALSEAERAAWRRQGLTWLAAELKRWQRRVGPDGGRRRQVMRVWYQHGALATVRRPEELARLPAEEARAWLRLWEQVRALATGPGS
jgi:tetratricopeptide (TPR) repeat protein